MYSLVAKDKNSDKEILIAIKTKTFASSFFVHNVSAIDHLTTCFEDLGQLTTQLYNHNHIDFINAKLYISYPYNGKNFSLPVLYSDKRYIRDLVKFNKCNIYNKDLLKQICNAKLNLADEELIQYLIHSSKIKNQHFQGHMQDWSSINSEESYDKMLTDLKRNYKTFRDMIVAIDAYEKSKMPEQYEQLTLPIPEAKQKILQK